MRSRWLKYWLHREEYLCRGVPGWTARALPTISQEQVMKFTIVAVIGLAVAVTSTLAVGQDTPAAPSGLKDLKSQVAYGLGMKIGQNLKTQATDLDPDLIAKGLKDAFSGAKPVLTEQQINEAIQTFSMQMQAQMQAKQAKQ